MKNLGLVFGSEGMLGTDIIKIFKSSGYTILSPSRQEIDITNANLVHDFLTEYRPQWVINCAAKHDLISCEKDLSSAIKINSNAVSTLAQSCADIDSYFIHISTDYVFDGTKGAPYIEADTPNPLNNYGKSKLIGENFALEKKGRVCILRVAALFGASISRDKGLNCFVDRMRQKLISGEKLFVNNKQIISPTSTIEVANQLTTLVREQPTGVAHCVNNGFTTYYNLTNQIANHLNFTPSRIKSQIMEREITDGISRPLNSALENRKLSELNLNFMQDWDNALDEYLKTNTA